MQLRLYWCVCGNARETENEESQVKVFFANYQLALLAQLAEIAVKKNQNIYT